MTDLRPTTGPSDIAQRRAFYEYVLLVALLSLPFYALNALAPELLPKLPPSALAVVCPVAAAVILTYRASGAQGVRSFLCGALDIRKTAPLAWLPATLAPVASWAAYAVPSALDSAFAYTTMSPRALFGLSAAFMLGAIAEELGWTAYALRQLGARTSSLRAGLEIGLVWAAWHVLPLHAVGRSASWIAWWIVGTLARRVFFVVLARAANGGSTAVVALSHALHNLVWMLIPWYGSAYDPRADALALCALAASACAFRQRSTIP